MIDLLKLNVFLCGLQIGPGYQGILELKKQKRSVVQQFKDT